MGSTRSAPRGRDRAALNDRVVGGNEPVPRTEITRKLWDYIRSHNLQDPSNKTKINADEKLKQVFDGREQVTMFEMTKLVFNHVQK